jgi:hypothetical protein
MSAMPTLQHSVSVQHRLPSHPDVPEAARDLADGVAADQAGKEREAAERRMRKVNDVAAAVRRDVSELIGVDAYRAFRQTLWTERMRTREMFLPPDGLKADFEQVHQARKARADTFLRDCGVAPEQLRALLRNALAELPDYLGSPLEGNAGDLATAVAPAGSPAAHPSSADRPRAFAIQPPFDGFQRGFHFANLAGSGFSGSVVNAVDQSGGNIHQQLHIENRDASDFDFAEAVADAQIAFWFQPSVSGRVRLTLETVCNQSVHSFRSVDEWGWSDSDTNQTNSLMMHVLHPNVAGPSFALTSQFRWMTDVTQDVIRSFIPVGTPVVATLTSDGAIPAGQWVVIRAGTRSTTTSFTNDVEIHSTPDFRWLVRAVAIEMVP